MRNIHLPGRTGPKLHSFEWNESPWQALPANHDKFALEEIRGDFAASRAWPPRNAIASAAGDFVPPLRISGVPLDMITAESVLTHVAELSDDRYEGRDSPSKGLDMAAAYIRNVASAHGLIGANRTNSDPFMQPFKVYGMMPLARFQETFRPFYNAYSPQIYGPKLFEHAIHEKELRRRFGARAETRRYFEWGDAANVVGVLEGSDSVLKNEYVIVSAHYDHIGTRRSGADRIYNGADDNASGASALLSMLPALEKMKGEGKGPKRSIIFIWTAAEEKGLVGADFYRKNPLRPLDKTKAAINIDMIGRLSPDQLSVIDVDRQGNNNLFHTMHDEASRVAGVQKINHDVDEYIDRQDGGIWLNAQIPTMFMFEGFNPQGRLNPDYHGVDDEVDKIRSENGGVKLSRAARFALLMLVAAANR